MSEMNWLPIVLAYFLGSIPFGLLVVRFSGLGDIRDIGSGNIGATNVMRTGKHKIGVITLLLDMFKGTLATLIAYHFSPDFYLAAGLAAMLGHIYPVWLKFKGGKGVATFIGVVLAISPGVAFLVMLVWFITFQIWRYSSLASLAATLVTPLLCLFLVSADAGLWTLLMGIVIFLRHRSNIDRLIEGDEPKFERRKPENVPGA